ncbi:hypothetical protein [Streptomyces sp. JV184]|nr:hypothetical protein [Streptomyces sp. JV184]MEE1745247.1 hypothetical protein [Streptomyces sp. JV184]
MDDGDWFHGLDLRDPVDTGVEEGRVLVDPVPFQEQWLAGPAR